jgi:DNA-binding NarL/FixJ family response regulator
MDPLLRRSVLKKISAHRTRMILYSAQSPVHEPFGKDADRLGLRFRHTPACGSPPLTRRESEILHYVAMGQTDREIAEQLYLSRRTVSCHVSRILAKLEVSSRRAAALAAARAGILRL